MFQGIERSIMANGIWALGKDKRMRSVAACILLAVVISMGLATAPSVAACSEGGNRFKWGFDERVRQTYIQNGFDLSDGDMDDWNFIRARLRLWGEWQPVDGLKLHVALNNEHRHWFKSTKGYEDEEFEINELVFEKLYLSYAGIGGSPVSVTAGRQNIMYGEGFLFMDGGPGDGSRTGYFNAVRVKVAFEERSLEFHVLSDPSRDNYLPVANCQHQPLIEYKETGAGVYYTDTSLDGKKIEGYCFFKNEKHDDNALPESNIYTFGGRLSGTVGGRINYATEWAYQLGDRGDDARRGLGGYAHGTYDFPGAMKPALTAGVVYLSGDDPGTREYEGWNPLYSRWPKWSELYIYTLARHEHGVAYWDNLFAPNLGVSLKPVEKITLKVSLYYMVAPQSFPDSVPGKASSEPIFGGGNFRGLLSAFKLEWAIKKQISGHLLWERFAPGDYYNDRSDTANFLRWEVFYSF